YRIAFAPFKPIGSPAADRSGGTTHCLFSDLRSQPGSVYWRRAGATSGIAAKLDATAGRGDSGSRWLDAGGVIGNDGLVRRFSARTRVPLERHGFPSSVRVSTETGPR